MYWYTQMYRISSIEQEHNKIGRNARKRRQSTDQIHEISNYCAKLFLEEKMDIRGFVNVSMNLGKPNKKHCQIRKQ